MTSRRLRKLARESLPKDLVVRAWAAYCRRRARSARAAFESAGDSPAFLGWDELDALQRAYPLDPGDYPTDPRGLEDLSRRRIAAMLRPLGSEADRLRRYLDLGAWDGILVRQLQAMGKSAVGVDIRSEGLAPQTAGGRVPFAEMDAQQLGIADNTFDFVFSFNSFEHFPDPAQALGEAARVVRPGGYIYLEFGPIYYSARGAHQFETISVPYVECLFTKELLAEYAAENGIALTEFFWMNEWSLTRYRELWRRMSDELEVVDYYEIFNADHVNLIERYPSCFRDKTRNFDDLLVSNIEVLFRKMKA